MGNPKDPTKQLLSSGVPLEHAVGKYLAGRRFSVESDFSYRRLDEGTQKDFSVDIRALGMLPTSNENSVLATLELLVECKYRNRDKRWLFFPDVNDADLSPIGLGYTLRAVQEFSYDSLDLNATVPFDEPFRWAMKGVELGADGHVNPTDISQGLAQLQYALPRLLRDHIVGNAFSLPADAQPLFFCPILVTTAPLFILRDDTALADIEAGAPLEDMADEVESLLVHRGFGPDFESHSARAFSQVPDDLVGKLLDLSNARKKLRAPGWKLPLEYFSELSRAERAHLWPLFTQFVVCNDAHLGTLIDRLIAVSEAACSRPDK